MLKESQFFTFCLAQCLESSESPTLGQIHAVRYVELSIGHKTYHSFERNRNSSSTLPNHFCELSVPELS